MGAQLFSEADLESQGDGTLMREAAATRDTEITTGIGLLKEANSARMTVIQDQAVSSSCQASRASRIVMGNWILNC
jgi:hypothetical protein